MSSADILRDNLAVARKMHTHLSRSHTKAAPIIPLQTAAVSTLDNEQIDLLDLYLSRFGKLQDYMVSKVFRAIAKASLEDTSQDVSTLDTLNRMAKFGVITNLDAWLKARLLRNAFAHEYLDDDAAIAENVNAAFALFDLLETTLATSEAFYEQRIKR